MIGLSGPNKELNRWIVIIIIFAIIGLLSILYSIYLLIFG